MYSGCSYLIDLTAILFFLHNLCNFYWIPLLFIFIEETNQLRIMFYKNISIFRSSRSQKFFEVGVLKNFATFTGKHLCWSLFWQCRRACTRDIVGQIREYALQDFCNGLGIPLLQIFESSHWNIILRNRCSDLYSHNPWKIPLMRLIFSKVAGFQQFLSLPLAGEFRASFFLEPFFAAANGLLR